MERTPNVEDSRWRGSLNYPKRITLKCLSRRVIKIISPSREREYFAMLYPSVDSDLHPSGLNDWAEALIIAAGPVKGCEGDTVTSGCPSRSYTPDSVHSHDFEPCLGGQAHGQGAPVYSCGCYWRTKVEPADASEQHQRLGLEQEVDHGSEIWPCKRFKSTFKSDALGDITPRHFRQNLSNVQRAESAPVLEVLKCRKLGKAFELNGSTTHETLVLNVVKRLEAAIDRQTEVLSRIYGVLESHAK
ncbi:hypothetical protein DFH29DRAFT_881078 [Suillus ampliporus]|nr:hypothetical protein DFH29DRAFT_881078 [Suillus ampliporus]